MCEDEREWRSHRPARMMARLLASKWEGESERDRACPLGSHVRHKHNHTPEIYGRKARALLLYTWHVPPKNLCLEGLDDLVRERTKSMVCQSILV